MRATDKGAAGERGVKGLAYLRGWQEVIDLARTYPGADLLAISRAPNPAFYGDEPVDYEVRLWMEVKKRPWRKVGREEKIHARECWKLHRPDHHLMVNLQAPHGGQDRRAVWTITMYDGQPLKGRGRAFITSVLSAPPSWARGLPVASKVDAPRGVAESGAVQSGSPARVDDPAQGIEPPAAPPAKEREEE